MLLLRSITYWGPYQNILRKGKQTVYRPENHFTDYLHLPRRGIKVKVEIRDLIFFTARDAATWLFKCNLKFFLCRSNPMYSH